MTFHNNLYIDRSLPCLAIIRAAFHCNRWGKLRDPQLNTMQRVRGQATLISKFHVSIKPLPLRAQITPQKRRKKGCKGIEETKKIRLSK